MHTSFEAPALAILALALTACNAPSPTSTNVAASASAMGTGQPAATAAPREIVGALAIRVSYGGAVSAPPTVTRTKEEAKRRAGEVLQKLRAGTPFDEIAGAFNDDPTTRATGGAMGNFDRTAVPRAFAEAAFALEVGALSEVVETEQGFHVIKRVR